MMLIFLKVGFVSSVPNTPRFLDRIHMARLIANYSNKFIVVSDERNCLDEFKDFYRENLTKMNFMNYLKDQKSIYIANATHE